MKAIGVGITVNLQDISFKIKSKNLYEDKIIDDTELYIKNEPIQWKFLEVLLDREHCVAVALNTHHNEKVPFKIVTFEELMQSCVPLIKEDESFVNDFFKKLDK